MIIVARERISNHPILKSITSAYNLGAERCFNIFVFSDLLRLLKIKKTKYIIVSDPLVFSLLKIIKPSSEIIFFSLEMFENQLPNNSVRGRLRYFLFFFTHKMALNKSNLVIFPNKVRLRYYLFNKILKSKNYLIVENLPSKEIMAQINDLNNFPTDKLRNDFFQEFSIPSRLLNKKIMVYGGSLSIHRGIPNIIKMIEKSKEWVLLIAGNDRQGLFKNHKYNNLFFLGLINKKDSLKLVKIANIQFSNYSNNLTNTRYCAPVKVFESIALNTPFFVNKSYGIESLSVKKAIITYNSFNDLKNVDKYFSKMPDVTYYQDYSNYEQLLLETLKLDKFC